MRIWQVASLTLASWSLIDESIMTHYVPNHTYEENVYGEGKKDDDANKDMMITCQH